MKRALILIITLTVFTFGSGWLLDGMQQRTAMRYLSGLYHIRQLVFPVQAPAFLRKHGVTSFPMFCNSIINHS